MSAIIPATAVTMARVLSASTSVTPASTQGENYREVEPINLPSEF